MAGLDVFENFIKYYFRARPWMLEADGSFKISSLDMDPDNPADWGGEATTSDEGRKTPAAYFAAGRDWMLRAERIAKLYDKHEDSDRSANLAMLAMASALLGICAQFIREQGDA